MQESFGFKGSDLDARINELLPDDRFFCYHDKHDKKAFIKAEFDRLLKDSFEAGGKVIDSCETEGFFQPTQMTQPERS